MNSKLFGTILLIGLLLAAIVSVFIMVRAGINAANATPTTAPRGFVLYEERSLFSSQASLLIDVRQAQSWIG